MPINENTLAIAVCSLLEEHDMIDDTCEIAMPQGEGTPFFFMRAQRGLLADIHGFYLQHKYISCEHALVNDERVLFFTVRM